MKKLLTLIIVLFVQISFAQKTTPFYKTYTWDKNPSYQVKKDKNADIIALKDKVITEFVFEEEGLFEYYLEHKVLWLNSDENIEEYNKIYLPYSSTTQLIVNKARVINKDGDIQELNESNIHTAVDEETNNNYKYFAFEGIEKGSIIEYYYVFKRHPVYKGKKTSFQSDFKKYDVSFDLYAPTNLIFKFKSYNGLPEVEKDTLLKNKNHWFIAEKEIEKLDMEELSAYHASKKFLVYKLDENLYSNAKDISSYGATAQNIYSFYNPEYNKKDEKAISQFISEILTGNEKNNVSKIRRIEYYIKNSIYLSQASSESLSNIQSVITNKIADEVGIMRLYNAIFKNLDIKHNIVITSDRQYLKFDPDFEANCFLTDFLIYFPKSKLYLSPTVNESRLGFPPAYLTDNYGLFIKEVTLGEFTSGVGKIKYIKPVKANKTVDDTKVDVSFDKDDISITNVKLNKSISGYYAMYYQPYINTVSEENKTELMEAYAKNLDEDASIISKEMKNDDAELFGIKPLVINVNFTSEAFVEKAGKKYLFKVGDLIGQQMQLYQEKERVLDLENEFERSYLRTINIKIPEGYKIANLEDIIIDNSYIKEGEELLYFKSYYELEGNNLKITANEHYRINIIEQALYEEYRKVINSAADFNKVTLVLEPK